MTIVATTDTRNSAWASDTSTFGHKMLAKMGWKGGENGLGKNQQGTSTHLRAVRRAESLGIGAENDSFGDKGWQDTNAGFHGVLASLKKEYSTIGNDGSGSEEEDAAAKKKRKKEEKKRKKKEEKRRAKYGGGSGNSSSSEGNGVRLPQNKVQAGHARKMRDAKDIRNKSAADMAAIFGVKADFYKQPREWGVVGSSDDGKDGSADSSDSVGEKKKKKKLKTSKKNKNDVDGKLKKDKKKRRRSSEEGSDSEGRKKIRKDKLKE